MFKYRLALTLPWIPYSVFQSSFQVVIKIATRSVANGNTDVNVFTGKGESNCDLQKKSPNTISTSFVH